MTESTLLESVIMSMIIFTFFQEKWKNYSLQNISPRFFGFFLETIKNWTILLILNFKAVIFFIINLKEVIALNNH